MKVVCGIRCCEFFNCGLVGPKSLLSLFYSPILWSAIITEFQFQLVFSKRRVQSNFVNMSCDEKMESYGNHDKPQNININELNYPYITLYSSTRKCEQSVRLFNLFSYEASDRSGRRLMCK